MIGGKHWFMGCLCLGVMCSLVVNAESIQRVDAVPGEYLVKLKKGMPKMSTESLNVELGSVVKSYITEQKVVVVKRPVIENFMSAEKMIKNSEYVEYVEPNYIYKIVKSPNDPMFGKLWGLNNVGQADSKGQAGTSGIDIKAIKAWDITTGSKDVVVAVIDTGVDYKNPELADNMWTNEAEANGKPGVDDDNNGYIDDIHGVNFATNSGDPMDDHGHGSHCSGTIGGRGNDGVGVAGVNWNVSIMALKFLTQSGSGTLEDAIKAINYATKMGAKIMSNSWGGGGYSQTLFDAIQAADKAGILFVAAAGNESNNNDSSPSYPNSYKIPNIVSVAAIDNKGKLASFSNWGKKTVHLAAPGVNILSTTLNKAYDSWSGTSMATPHVSGVAALLIAKDRNLTHYQMKDRLVKFANPLAGLRNKVASGAMLDAYASLTETPPAPLENPANWKFQTQNISTPHPYKANYTQTWSIKVPGASQIAIYFEKFETESGYDFVSIKDSKGNAIENLDGNHDGSFTSIIEGDSATITIKADDIEHRYGFDLTRVYYK